MSTVLPRSLTGDRNASVKPLAEALEILNRFAAHHGLGSRWTHLDGNAMTRPDCDRAALMRLAANSPDVVFAQIDGRLEVLLTIGGRDVVLREARA